MILLNGKPVELMTFPNGEHGGELDLGDTQSYNRITLKYESDADLMHLQFVSDHLLRNGEHLSELVIPYMPYSRMDRTKGGWMFTLRSVCEHINSFQFAKVVVAEPHSDVCVALLDNCHAVYPTMQYLPKLIEEIGFDKRRDYIVFPDGGAEKRYDLAGLGYKVLVGHKVRNYQTGKIKSMDFSGHLDENSMPGYHAKTIIVDDLCSYGGTFVAAVDRLASKWGFEQSYLLVAHCENGVYDGKLLNTPGFKGLYTTDSIHGPFGNYGKTRSEKVHIYDWSL